jgi:hypothetical protein
LRTSASVQPRRSSSAVIAEGIERGWPRGRIADPEGDLDASAGQVVHSHGRPRCEHGGAEEEARDERSDADR